MKFHIVRNDETLEDILYLYNLSKDELIEQNKHIRVWSKLIPGTKLRIPPIPESIQQEVTDMEPFVEDYYPKLNPEQLNSHSTAMPDSQEDVDIISTEDNEETSETMAEKKITKSVTSTDEELKSKQEAVKKEVMEKLKQLNMVREAGLPAGGYYYPRYQPYYTYPYHYQKRSI